MSFRVDIAAAMQPRADEVLCGDMTFTQILDDDVFIVCMDVMGHGKEAHVVAQRAVHYLEKTTDFNPTNVLLGLDSLLSGGRGAAVAACRIDKVNSWMEFAAVGNIVVRRIFSSVNELRLISKDGVVGQNMRQPKLQKIALQDGDIYVLHSDGIKSHFCRGDYPQIISDSASVAVAHIIRNFSKEHDDASCIVFKVNM